MIGTTLEHYRITERLGAGGMGEVYLAVDIELDRVVAIKRLRQELAYNEEIAERFRAEARVLAKLDHPNVATVYRFFSHEDSLFLVMEYVDGKPFGEITRRGGLPTEQALPLFQQALSGIGYAHAAGVVHRDLKPSNLMLSDRGQVKVLDFGIAHLVGSSRMTRTGMVVGTPAYMAPEQIRGLEIDPRTDLYALGIVFYEMLTGQLPYEADSDFDIMRAHVELPPRPLDQLSPNVPAALQSAILRALAKDTGERFANASEFADAIAGNTPSAAVTAPLTPEQVATLTREPRTAPGETLRNALQTVTGAVRRVPPLAATGGLVAILAVALVALLLQPGQPQVEPAQGGAAVGGVASPAAMGAGGAPNPAGFAAAGSGTTGTAAASDTTAADPGAAPGDATAIAGTPPTGGDAGAAAPTGATTAPTKPIAAAPAPKRAAPKPPATRARFVKIDVHGSMRRGGPFARPAGYNALVELSKTPGGRPIEVEEIVEARLGGERMLREVMASKMRKPGRFQVKSRVAALRSLEPDTYDMQLKIVAGGRELAVHKWKLRIK